MQRWAKSFLVKTHFIRVIAENEFVVLHYHQEWSGYQDYAGINIFQFENNVKVIAHWDVLQVVTSDSTNKNGFC